MVLTILGIAGAIAIPKFSGIISAGRLDRAMDGLAADLSLARVRAVRDNRETAVRIDSNSRYVLYVNTGSGQAADTVKRVAIQTSYPGVTLSPVTITFDSRGMLRSGVTVTATQGTRTRTLSITGLGRVYRDY